MLEGFHVGAVDIQGVGGVGGEGAGGSGGRGKKVWGRGRRNGLRMMIQMVYVCVSLYDAYFGDIPDSEIRIRIGIRLRAR